MSNLLLIPSHVFLILNIEVFHFLRFSFVFLNYLTCL